MTPQNGILRTLLLLLASGLGGALGLGLLRHDCGKVWRWSGKIVSIEVQAIAPSTKTALRSVSRDGDLERRVVWWWAIARWRRRVKVITFVWVKSRGGAWVRS